MAQLEIEPEIPIVDPDRIVLEGYPLEALTVAGQCGQDGFYGAVDCADVDAASALCEGALVAYLRGDRVQVAPLILDEEEGGALGGESFVVKRRRILGHLDVLL